MTAVSPPLPVTVKLTLSPLTEPLIVPVDEQVGPPITLADERAVPFWRINMSSVELGPEAAGARVTCQFPLSWVLGVGPPVGLLPPHPARHVAHNSVAMRRLMSFSVKSSESRNNLLPRIMRLASTRSNQSTS